MLRAEDAELGFALASPPSCLSARFYRFSKSIQLHYYRSRLSTYSTAASMAPTASQLLNAFLDTTVNSIVPLTAKGVASGCKVFGAA